MSTTVDASGLSVVVSSTGRRILCGVDLSFGAGQVVGVVGESGSGKSTLVRALLGAAAPSLEVTGEVRISSDGTVVDMFRASRRTVRSVRSTTMAFLGQNPAAGLTPTMRVGDAIGERLGGLSRPDREARTRELVESLRLPADVEFLRRFPHELSGGQAQRVALARALASQPRVLLLDEPTTGLDVVTQAQILDELSRLQEQAGLATLIVSHDLAVVARLADTVVVMRNGEVVETGGWAPVLSAPGHAYTQTLVAVAPDHRVVRSADRDRTDPVEGEECDPSDRAHDRFHDHDATEPVLEVLGLHAGHRIDRRRRIVAAAGVDLDVHAGECVALVGSSGSGKSTMARVIVGAHRRDAGVVRLLGRDLGDSIASRRQADRWAIQLIPQDPAGSLNPRRRVGSVVADVVRRRRPGVDADAAAHDLFVAVGLDPSLADRRPGTLSGGERQRVAIARALAAEPQVLICDEITSALDVSVQAGVLDLVRRLIEERRLAVFFISHDLGVVARVADRVAVLEGGRICEHGSVVDVLRDPSHEITQELLAASPSLVGELSRRGNRPVDDVRTPSFRLE